MDQKKARTYIAAILTTLNECDGWGPRSHIMLGCGISYDEFVLIESVMTNAGLITHTSEIVKLTQEGRELAQKIEDALKG